MQKKEDAKRTETRAGMIIIYGQHVQPHTGEENVTEI